MDGNNDKHLAQIRDPEELEYILSKLDEGCCNDAIAISALRIANALERIADSHGRVYDDGK